MSVFVESSHRFDGFVRRARGVSGDRLERREMRAPAEALRVERGRHAQHAQPVEAAFGERVRERLDERRQARPACCSRRR